MRRNGVRLQVEFGLKDDEFLFEAGGMRTEKVDRLVVFLLFFKVFS